MTRSTPIALTIAGSDSGGGAGLQADLKTFSANGVYGASVVTAVTAQNTQAVCAVHEIPAQIVKAQIDMVLSDLNVGAIKIGMLFSPAIIDATAEAISGFDGPVILDPVMIAKSGDALLQDEAIARLKTHLIPRADLITPNLPEAARLLGAPEAETPAQIQAQGEALLKLGPKAVLMKGGHSKSAICSDFLITSTGTELVLEAPRQETQNTHGTGCTYSAAIAAIMSKGADLSQAVKDAHSYLQTAISAADDLTIGHGHGPVHHFHGIWG